MTTSTAARPEDIVIAVLHKVGGAPRIVSNLKLASLFDEAAQKHPDLFGDFSAHPQYHDSKLLRDTLQALDLGGSIVRENASTKYFRVASRMVGAYGADIYSRLDTADKSAIDELAEKISEAYKA